MDILRLLRHLMTGELAVRRALPEGTLARIEAEIAATETKHRAELRFAVQDALPLGALARGVSPRAAAVEAFSRLRVWDTEENSGVLVYLLFADRDVEIVADRGVAAKVANEEWERVCRAMEAAFREGRFEEGALEDMRAAGALLAQHFPARPDNPDELSNRPVML